MLDNNKWDVVLSSNLSTNFLFYYPIHVLITRWKNFCTYLGFSFAIDKNGRWKNNTWSIKFEGLLETLWYLCGMKRIGLLFVLEEELLFAMIQRKMFLKQCATYQKSIWFHIIRIQSNYDWVIIRRIESRQHRCPKIWCILCLSTFYNIMNTHL